MSAPSGWSTASSTSATTRSCRHTTRLWPGAGPPTKPARSALRRGLAKSLGLKLGDALRFDIAGTMVDGRITSLRKVDWSSMRVNFFVLFPTAAMADVPATYIAAFRAPTQQTSAFDNGLSRDFPNITNIDVSTQIAQVQRVLDQVIRAVEFLFGFTLAAGMVVLFAAITATRESRAREFAVMRAMGAGSKLLGQVQRAELLGRGCARRGAGLARRHGGGAGRSRALPSSLRGIRRPGCRWSVASPVRCWRWPQAGGGCAKCCVARWWRPCAARRNSAAARIRRSPRCRCAARAQPPAWARPAWLLEPSLKHRDGLAPVPGPAA